MENGRLQPDFSMTGLSGTGPKDNTLAKVNIIRKWFAQTDSRS
jgi:hypothetical protein